MPRKKEVRTNIVEPLFDSDFRVKKLVEDLQEVVDSHTKEFKFTRATVIGCLECVKEGL